MQLWPRDLWALGSQTAGGTECGRAWAGVARLGGRGLSMPRCAWVLTCVCMHVLCACVCSCVCVRERACMHVLKGPRTCAMDTVCVWMCTKVGVQLVGLPAPLSPSPPGTLPPSPFLSLCHCHLPSYPDSWAGGALLITLCHSRGRSDPLSSRLTPRPPSGNPPCPYSAGRGASQQRA